MGSDVRISHFGHPDSSGMIGFVLGLCALLVSSGCGGGSTGGTNILSDGPVVAKVIGTIAAGMTPRAVAVDPASNTIYVANFGQETNSGQGSTSYCPGVNGTLTTIDGATQSVATSALPPAGAQYPYENPLDLAVNSASHTVYVAARLFEQPNATCYYYGGLQIFNSGTLAQTATAPSHGAPFAENVAVNEQTGNVYWSDYEGSSVVVVDAMGNLLSTTSLASRPDGIAVNANSNKIYVITTYPNTSLIVIDGSTNAVVSTITGPNLPYPEGLAVNATTNTIYVANGQGCTCNRLAVINGSSDTVTKSISLGPGPAAVAVDSKTNFIYVANAGNYDFNQTGSVTVIDGATNTTTELTDPNLTYPYRIAVNPTTNKIYVLSLLSNNVTVIDGAHH